MSKEDVISIKKEVCIKNNVNLFFIWMIFYQYLKLNYDLFKIREIYTINFSLQISLIKL